MGSKDELRRVNNLLPLYRLCQFVYELQAFLVLLCVGFVEFTASVVKVDYRVRRTDGGETNATVPTKDNGYGGGQGELIVASSPQTSLAPVLFFLFFSSLFSSPTSANIFALPWTDTKDRILK